MGRVFLKFIGHSNDPTLEALDKFLFTIENCTKEGFEMNFNHPHNHRLFNGLSSKLTFDSQNVSKEITIGNFKYNFTFHPEKTEAKRFLPDIVGDDQPYLVNMEKSGEKTFFNYKQVFSYNYNEFIFIYSFEVWYTKNKKNRIINQAKTRQHFLPKVYLKGFANDNKAFAKSLDNKYDKSIREYSIENSLFLLVLR